MTTDSRETAPVHTPSLAEVAAQVPLGWECRSCGASTYNMLLRAHYYVTEGKTCCPNFADWVRRASVGEPSVYEAHKAKLALSGKALGASHG